MLSPPLLLAELRYHMEEIQQTYELLKQPVWRNKFGENKFQVKLMLSVFTSDVSLCHTHMVEIRDHRSMSPEATSNYLSNAKNRTSF